jgi:hypothetical protein
MKRRWAAVFDFRYHVASLAAVFIALVTGIIVGVAISGSGFVESQERDLLNAEIRALRDDVERARERQRELEASQSAAQAFVDESYGAVIADRLRDRRIAVLFVGQTETTGVLDAVDRAVTDAGGERVRLLALEVPIDGRLDAIESELASRPALAGYAGGGNLRNLGRDLAREFVSGGSTPLWDALSGELVQEREGLGQREAHAVVVVRTAEPQEGTTARFLRGVYDGLGGSVPAVGVEPARAATSAIDVFRRSRLSSVDNVDTPVGRVALALLLAGAREGHYGVKDTADAVLPPVEPLPPPPAGG